MTEDNGRVPSETGSRASIEPASGLAPSGFDPSRAPLSIIRENGIYGLGGHEGCPCTSFMVHGVNVEVSCHKSEQSVRIYSSHMDFCDEQYRRETKFLQPIADEVLRQVDDWYDAGGEYAAGFKVSFLSWEEENRDSDGSPSGRDGNRLDGEAATARAEGIAQGPVS